MKMAANLKEKRWTAKGKKDRQGKKKRGRKKEIEEGKRGRKTREGQDLGGERQNDQMEGTEEAGEVRTVVSFFFDHNPHPHPQYLVQYPPHSQVGTGRKRSRRSRG
jgi:hypothetical protein